MNALSRQLFAAAVCLSLVWLASGAYAQAQGVDLTVDKVIETITRLVCWFAQAASTLMVIAIIYYGIRITMAGGDETKLTENKKALGWALVGLVVLLGSYVIIATVASAVGADTSIIPLSC